jgi:hypothetical protein
MLHYEMRARMEGKLLTDGGNSKGSDVNEGKREAKKLVPRCRRVPGGSRLRDLWKFPQ